MTTGKFLLILFAVLTILSVVAMLWKPEENLDGKTRLTWVSDNNPARTAQIDAFNAEHPDLDLVLDYGNADSQKIILQSSSGVGPDIFDYSSQAIDTYVEAGILWDVTEAAKTMGFSAEKDGWPNSAEMLLYEGRQYGFPCNTIASILIYNKNVFDHFGVPYPPKTMTWEEFIALSKKFSSANDPNTKNHPRIYAVSGLSWRIFFESSRGEFFQSDGRLHIADNPELARAFDMHRDFLFTYRFMPTAVEARAMSGQGGWGGGDLIQFATGQYAMIQTGYYALISLGQAYEHQVQALAQRGMSLDKIKEPLQRPLRLGAVLLPKFSEKPPSYLVSARIAGINARSPHREEALKFLQYLAGPTYSRLLNEGIDALPGNPAYADLGVEPGPPALDRVAMQNLTKEAMNFGYTLRQSPFILLGDVYRILQNQISRLESDPTLTTEYLLASADTDLQTLMRRNLERNPKLKTLFIERFGKSAFQALR